MIEKHYNCESITSYNVFILELYFRVIQNYADDTEISDVCDNCLNLIDDLGEYIPPLLSLF